MERRLIYLWSFLIHFGTAGCLTSCDAPSVYKDQSASVTCHFDIDVSKVKNDVSVYKTNETGYHRVLKCLWMTNQRQCTPSPGYFVDGNITQELVLGIPAATHEYVGTYGCHIIPSEPTDLTTCNFTLKERSKETEEGEHSEEIGSLGTASIVGIVIGSLVGLALIALGIFLVYKYRDKLFGNRTQRDSSEDGNVEEQLQLNPGAPAEEQEITKARIRVVMIGSSGTGKSSLGNSILGADVFTPGLSFSSQTKLCAYHIATRGNYEFQVVDTPGLCDTHRDEEEVYREVAKSVTLVYPGPHIILMVLRCDMRFTKEEKKAYETLKQMFGEDMCKHMIIIFNGLDTFATDGNIDLSNMRDALENELSASPPVNLSGILPEAKGGYFGITNKVSKEVKDQQINDLIDRMMEVVRNNDYEHYNFVPLEDINRRIEELLQERLQQNPDKTKEQAEEELKQEIIQENGEQGFVAQLTALLRERFAAAAENLCKIM